MVQLRIQHTTGFAYDSKVAASFNEARMTPQTTTDQIVVHSRVGVSPSPWTYTYRDYWGTEVTAFEVFDPHDSLTVTATATVHTDRATSLPPALDWEQLRSDDVTDRFVELLEVSPRVAPPDELAAQCRDLAASGRQPGEVAREICALVHDEVRYVTGSTDVATTAADAWNRRSGVCQDLVHLAVGGLRSVGIPARYVSGYLHPDPEAPVGETVAGESHAWVSWWDEGWHGFDPTNDADVGDYHVVVAAGRDYGDVKPLGGIYSGSASSHMFVDVSVTRLG
ncbi:transglutaminase family protein [Nocardioides mangrovicus]|uniref:Transglutaminase family protein n=1 Tax=Nocardioides mangrovicus TaxID=2478913 RepID=A0A3L8P2A9_9ACTN|nr:transglutaminase family protein [Nocardioides mangrovicus]RLV49082.1 transglutaminase family protein [Nocardioides mangrovicus]